MQGKLKNRLFVIIRKREIELGYTLSQADVAKRLGVSEQLVSRWVRNEVTRFDADIVEKICAEFDCDLNDLLYLEPVQKD